MAAYVPAASVTKLTALNDIHDHTSKSAIAPPVGLVHLGHDISDCASKVRVYLQTGKIHAGYLRMSGDGQKMLLGIQLICEGGLSATWRGRCVRVEAAAHSVIKALPHGG